MIYNDERLLRALESMGSLAKVTNIIMKTTGECLSAETIEAGGKTHTAFVFIKPHANNEKAPEPENWDAWGCLGCRVFDDRRSSRRAVQCL